MYSQLLFTHGFVTFFVIFMKNKDRKRNRYITPSSMLAWFHIKKEEIKVGMT